MSLESLLAEMTEALKANTSATLASNELRIAGIETVKNVAAKETKTAAPKAAEPAAPKVAAPKAAEPEKAAEGKVTSEQSLAIMGKIQAYVGGADRDNQEWAVAERAARKAKIRTLLHHPAIIAPGTPDDVHDTANITAKGFDTAMATLQSFIDKGDLTAAPAADASTALDM